MSTQEQIAAGLTSIVDEHTSDDDGPCGAYEDGNAIANAAFNYGLSLAIESVVAASVDAPTNPALIALINELKEMRIPQ